MRTTLVAVAVAVMLVTAGTGAVMATPGNASGQGGNDNGPDGTPGANAANNSSQGPPDNVSAQAAGERGPPELPEQVPNHVHAIHEAIWDFLNSEQDYSLGEEVSGIATNATAEESADANATMENSSTGDLNETDDGDDNETDTTDDNETDGN